MITTTLIRYETRPDAAVENQRLIERVFAQLAAANPDGLRYMSFRLHDGVSFVHIAVTEDDDSPLTGLPAFADFQRDLGNRLIAPPTRMAATLVGSYRMLG
jgi:hypothetical protein